MPLLGLGCLCAFICALYVRVGLSAQDCGLACLCAFICALYVRVGLSAQDCARAVRFIEVRTIMVMNPSWAMSKPWHGLCTARLAPCGSCFQVLWGYVGGVWGGRVVSADPAGSAFEVRLCMLYL